MNQCEFCGTTVIDGDDMWTVDCWAFDGSRPFVREYDVPSCEDCYFKLTRLGQEA